MLSGKEEKVRNIMLNEFMPALRDVLMDGNRELFIKWGRNCCRQSSVLGIEVIADLLPEYQWSVFESRYRHEEYQTIFEHAWLLGRDIDGNGLFVDISPLSRPTSFVRIGKRDLDFHNIEAYRSITELNRVKVYHEEMLDQNEYFTNTKGSEVLSAIKNRMEEKDNE